MADKEKETQQEEVVTQPQVEKPSSLPDKPLEIDFDPDDMTLDEVVLFEPDGFTARGFRQFLIDHSNWSKREIGSIKVSELKQVADQVVSELSDIAVPKGK